MDRPVVIAGPPASGKTTLARALATELGVPWHDTDAVVVNEIGMSIADLFAREGEARFRTLERQALERLITEGSPGVFATGGGTLVDRTVRHAVLRKAIVLSLDAPIEQLVQRAEACGPSRPLLAGGKSEMYTKLSSLLEARAEAYSEAHAQIAAGEGKEATLAQARSALDDLWREPTLLVPLGKRTYRIHVAPLATLSRRITDLSPSAAVLVTDTPVAQAFAPESLLGDIKRKVSVVLAGRGDKDKTLTAVRRIWDAALGIQIDRDALIVAVGGGVVTDLSGFAAATLLRGVRCASAPTTLLAMVDASVGGKTGFDHPCGKNLIGAFHHPSVVVCDPAVLATLSPREMRSGLAEVVKIALIRDAALFDLLGRKSEQLRALDPSALAQVIPPAIQAKIDVVVRDEREGGERAVLNFGHTIGHALERATGYALPHGECVALGMRAALGLGVRLGITPPDVATEAGALMDALMFPAKAPARIDRTEAIRALGSDRKRKAGDLRFVLCDRVGSAQVHRIAPSDAEWALSEVLQTRIARRG